MATDLLHSGEGDETPGDAEQLGESRLSPCNEKFDNQLLEKAWTIGKDSVAWEWGVQ
jgi:hypothetical protein